MECVEGADVTLSRGGKLLASTVTDSFGDFRFENLPEDGGAYHVEASHAHGSVRRDIVLVESTYLGELRLVPGEGRKEDIASAEGAFAGAPG
jgi:hypothetical protein